MPVNERRWRRRLAHPLAAAPCSVGGKGGILSGFQITSTAASRMRGRGGLLRGSSGDRRSDVALVAVGCKLEQDSVEGGAVDVIERREDLFLDAS